MNSANDGAATRVGLGVFGPAYRKMLEHDAHAPGSVDCVLAERMVLVCPETVEGLYGPAASGAPAYDAGSRPALERVVAELEVAGMGGEQCIEAIARFTARLADRVADETLEEMRLGGTEEQIVARGSDWCTDVARVACALLQIAGFAARIANIADVSQAYSGHAIVEAYRGGLWGAVDSSSGVVYRHGDGRPASVWDLVRDAELVRAHESPGAFYTRPAQFAAAAIAEYRIEDAAEYDYTLSGINDYYRSILEHSIRGWPGGLRWLHGEGAARGLSSPDEVLDD
jgi:hypothetical protein